MLINYQFTKVKNYIFFIEPLVPFDNGVFMSFESEKELLSALENELVLFCNGVDFDENVQEEMINIFPDSVEKIDEKKINELLIGWHLGYVGTVEDLITSMKESPRWFRKQYRNYFDLDPTDAPILIDELDNFKIFLLPEWMR